MDVVTWTVPVYPVRILFDMSLATIVMLCSEHVLADAPTVISK